MKTGGADELSRTCACVIYAFLVIGSGRQVIAAKRPHLAGAYSTAQPLLPVCWSRVRVRARKVSFDHLLVASRSGLSAIELFAMIDALVFFHASTPGRLRTLARIVSSAIGTTAPDSLGVAMLPPPSLGRCD